MPRRNAAYRGGNVWANRARGVGRAKWPNASARTANGKDMPPFAMPAARCACTAGMEACRAAASVAALCVALSYFISSCSRRISSFSSDRSTDS
eukprot:3414993-Pleurochrysis_carterae.AAC.1